MGIARASRTTSLLRICKFEIIRVCLQQIVRNYSIKFIAVYDSYQMNPLFAFLLLFHLRRPEKVKSFTPIITETKSGWITLYNNTRSALKLIDASVNDNKFMDCQCPR